LVLSAAKPNIGKRVGLRSAQRQATVLIIFKINILGAAKLLNIAVSFFTVV
jgi:hypothetical protein